MAFPRNTWRWAKQLNANNSITCRIQLKTSSDTYLKHISAYPLRLFPFALGHAFMYCLRVQVQNKGRIIIKCSHSLHFGQQLMSSIENVALLLSAHGLAWTQEEWLLLESWLTEAQCMPCKLDFPYFKTAASCGQSKTPRFPADNLPSICHHTSNGHTSARVDLRI